MKKNDKKRLFEVMHKLDKTFKPSLNENFDNELPAEPASVEIDATETPEVEEKTIEQKYDELKEKVGELYTLVNGGDATGEEEEEASVEIDNNTSPEENLQEWNFDKKKDDDEKDDEKPKEEKKDDDKEELDETKPNVPVKSIPTVG